MFYKKLYNCILSQVLSPCGNILVCGNIYGDIAVYDIDSIFNGTDKVPDRKPECFFKSPNGEQVCSMASSPNFLIAGTVGSIFGWSWDSIKNFKPELAWTIELPHSRDRLQKTDVNALLFSENEIRHELFAGCGDNVIYLFNLEDGKIIRTFDGHSDYIHSLSSNDCQMSSASEDGTVQLWDLRKATMTAKIEPYKEQKLSRNQFGKWIGDVSITNDWLVCGGGPRCSLWHMRTMGMMTPFSELQDFEIYVAKIQGDSILCGGASSLFYQTSFTGQVTSKMTTSNITLFTALYSNTPRNILTLAGSSNKIDMCTNFTYRHQVLNFYT